MYQSRLHATNGIISIAVDALSGEVLEFVRESTWDNVTKNHVRNTWSLFDAVVHTEAGDKRLHAPRYLDVRANEALTPVITIDQQEKCATVTIDFPGLVLHSTKDGIAAAKVGAAGIDPVDIKVGIPVDMSARVVIELPEGDCRSKWRMSLTNNTDWEVDTVAFPAIDGMWLGDSWEDDVLVYPRFAGWQIVNPTQKLAADAQRIVWKWQEYQYTYHLNEATGAKDDRGAYVMHLPYSGAASMMWMDLYDPNEKTGLYITCRTSGDHMMGLRAESFGETNPGTGMAILHETCLEKGTWESEECVFAFHEGDWHWAADEYRTWFESVHEPIPQTHRPKWFMESAGLMAHYDFQYQGGGIVHKYKDIPHIYDLAKELGFNHLLLSGWNRDGFDYGFPHYETNPNLGTEQELKDALAEVKAKGGHVAFYINSRLCNTGFEDEQENLEKFAIQNRDGSRFQEKYGAADVTFASMCINSNWRKQLLDTVNYLTHEIGADSMYLDQLAMASSVKCYNPEHEHGHTRNNWNEGYTKLIGEMIADYDPEGMALIYEGNNDVFGRGASAQLMTTLGGPFIGAVPEVYRYTFPDQVLTDMMNPRRNSAMRPEHVARKSTMFLYRAFVCGMYFWCYDLEWDNTWRRDPEQYERLKKTVALRVKWLKTYGFGTFRDNVGIVRAPADFMIKRYEIENGTLIAAASDKGNFSGEVSVVWDKPEAKIEARLYGDEENAVELPCTVENGAVTFQLPETELAVIVIR
ncbi:MAG: hypothetical protein IJ354_04605 [Clostridia bacterium]|nr:hypothetical protein [Clostridia bacterium]